MSSLGRGMRGYSQNTRENAQKISAMSNLGGEGEVFTWRAPDPPQPSFLQTPQKTCELAETLFGAHVTALELLFGACGVFDISIIDI